jgi:hypothetical protein
MGSAQGCRSGRYHAQSRWRPLRLVMVFVGFCERILLEGAVEVLVTLDDLDHIRRTVVNLANGPLALVLLEN